MKNRQVRLIMGILVGLVLFSSSLAFLFYTKQDEKGIQKETGVEVYIASRHLEKGEMIGSSDIQKTHLPQSYLSNTVLTKEEIIGRYSSVEIFEKELFRKEKLSLLKPKKEEEMTPQVEVVQRSENKKLKDTVMLPLSLFQNIDTSLKSGDYIDIVSVVPKDMKSKAMEFDTKYIALHILIDSFISNANQIKTVVVQTEKQLTRAESIVFEMSPNEIKNFFATYYKTQALNTNRVFNTSKTSKGHLWMVKCSGNEDVKAQKIKDRLMVDYVAAQRKRAKRVERVSISYED